MPVLYCENTNCRKEFKSRKSTRKFCSHSCYSEHRKSTLNTGSQIQEIIRRAHSRKVKTLGIRARSHQSISMIFLT
jgi:protein-arginine kinase activator protein McsA